MTHAQAWSDGGNREAIAACAVYMVIQDGGLPVRKVERATVYHGRMTNMDMEYLGVILAMKTALEESVTKLQLHVDNQTVDRHLRGIYQVREDRMRVYYDECLELGLKFEKISITWIPRNMNSVADRLCRDAMNGKKKSARPRPVALQKVIRPNPFARSSSDA